MESNASQSCIPRQKASCALRILIWLLRMLNEGPQIPEVLDARSIGICAIYCQLLEEH